MSAASIDAIVNALCQRSVRLDFSTNFLDGKAMVQTWDTATGRAKRAGPLLLAPVDAPESRAALLRLLADLIEAAS